MNDKYLYKLTYEMKIKFTWHTSSRTIVSNGTVESALRKGKPIIKRLEVYCFLSGTLSTPRTR